jgi:peroxiredoxin
LRRDYQEFVERGAEIIVIGPDERDSFIYHWRRGAYPFVGLPDPDNAVADQYGQQVKLIQMGRMPALFIIDRQGAVRFAHYGLSMQDIVSNREVLGILDALNQSA